MKKILCTYMQDPRFLPLFVIVAGTIALSGAYISQYVFGLDPCALCFYQRKPYFAVIALGLFTLAMGDRCSKATTSLLLLSVLGFLATAGLGGFHAGVEYGWWKGLEACSNFAMPSGASLNNLRAFIKSRDVVRCDVPAFTLLGISMAGFNFFYALGAATITLLLTVKKKCQKQTEK